MAVLSRVGFVVVVLVQHPMHAVLPFPWVSAVLPRVLEVLFVYS